MRHQVLLTTAMVLLPRLALACPVCFGASDGPMLQGSNMGILALLVVTLTVLGAFAAFIVSLVRRASQSSEASEQPGALAAGPSAGGGSR